MSLKKCAMMGGGQRGRQWRCGGSREAMRIKESGRGWGVNEKMQVKIVDHTDDLKKCPVRMLLHGIKHRFKLLKHPNDSKPNKLSHSTIKAKFSL